MGLIYCDACNKNVNYSIKEKLIKEYKGYDVNIMERVGVCDVCSNNLYIPELEAQNFKTLYGKYRELAGLINPEEIIDLRGKYNISQRELTAILNWGKMTINRYERGAVPTQGHSDYLKLINLNDHIFKEKTDEAFENKRITEKTYSKVLQRIESSISNVFQEATIKFLTHKEDEFNGFRSFDIERLINLISYIADKVELYKTSLNKYLWYIDFQNFKENVRSITGLRYMRYVHGPVIEGKMYEEILNHFDDKFYKDEYEDGDCIKTIIKSKGNYDLTIFKDEELEVINSVIDTFKLKPSVKISELSHKEKGWIENKNGRLISYEFADDLKLKFD